MILSFFCSSMRIFKIQMVLWCYGAITCVRAQICADISVNIWKYLEQTRLLLTIFL